MDKITPTHTDEANVHGVALDASSEDSFWRQAFASAASIGCGISVALYVEQEQKMIPTVFSWKGQQHSMISRLTPEQSQRFGKACSEMSANFRIGTHVVSVPTLIQHNWAMGTLILFSAEEVAKMHARVGQWQMEQTLPKARKGRAAQRF